MLSILFGLIAVAVGIWGIWIWNADFLGFLKGMMPVAILFAGVIAIVMGSARAAKKRP